MDSIKEKQTTDPFPLESLHRLRNLIVPEIEPQSNYAVENYDNRGRFSDVAKTLRSKLGFFQTRVTSSSFLSDAFSWQIKTATSSDPTRLLSRAASFARRVDYSFQVDQTASSQTATSNRYASNDATDFTTGTYSYALTVNDTVHDIDVEIQNNIGDPATHRSVLLAVERSINRLGLDVTATLEDSSQKEYTPYRGNGFEPVSQLVVSSSSSPALVNFALEDTSGNMIDTLGLNRTSHFGHKNQYRINGEPDRSDSNQVGLPDSNGSAYLLGTTGEKENLKVTIDQEKQFLSRELEQIISDYNDLIQWIDDNESVISPSLKAALFDDLPNLATKNRTVKSSGQTDENGMATTSNDFASVLNIGQTNIIDSELAAIGLTLNSDGSLDIEDEFEGAVSGRLQQVHSALAGENGFFTRISAAIDEIHGKKERNYVISLNSLVSYDSDGNNRQSVYKQNSGSLISFFA